ncbi:MAG: glycosyl transferase [Rhodospirillales bacterium RIFCSPLOWO2_12_FULL_58_28]|nr:MAG: glycosyl transferase [Rhodospirillales bacterium RIFCSPLOWO2_02_FULL_58_16]OHC78966.1 MAG: glycosyl transferase [Rhodospirillales bacterium RIFCSPLOWO2_12_FULL_58_28]
MSADIKLSAVISVRNEEAQLAKCLERLTFADEIVVLLDKCIDGSEDIAGRFTDRIVKGSWDTEGKRRNAAIEACRGRWIFEIDADERVPEALAEEIRYTVETSPYDRHEILVDNYIGGKLVRWGWGCSFGKAAYPGLFRKGSKIWGDQRVHPRLQWSGQKGAMLKSRLDHLVDRNISDMIRRLDNYSSARAKDLRDAGEIGSLADNIRRLFSRFFKCYVMRKGYREGGYGLLIALCAGLYPLLSHLKAKLEKD